jgi:general L-amino acid transport system substrate-binding protein
MEGNSMAFHKIYTTVIMITVITISGVSLGGTLDDVKNRGFVRVGVNGDVLGFSVKDKDGVWRGLDVDTGRAIAAAVFGDASKIKFIPVSAAKRFTSLQNGEIDVLCRNTTQTLTRETTLGIDFVQANYYDYQGLMVPKNMGIKNAKGLEGSSVCVIEGTTSELNLVDYFQFKGIKIKLVTVQSNAQLRKAFFTSKCDCMTSDASQLAAHRATAQNPEGYDILGEILYKEPLAPAVRQGDRKWYDIVNFTVFALINAEELRIYSKNVDEMLKNPKPKIQRFLGMISGNGKALGLDEKFAYHIIKQVGNYEEIFERNIGINTPLRRKRGLNALWYRGGLMQSPPFN